MAGVSNITVMFQAQNQEVMDSSFGAAASAALQLQPYSGIQSNKKLSYRIETALQGW